MNFSTVFQFPEYMRALRSTRLASHKQIAASLLVLMSLTGNLLSSQVDQLLPILPPSDWTVEHKTGDTVELSEAEGTLKIIYDVNVNEIRQVGHQQTRDATFRLLRQAPIQLDENQVRLLYESRLSGKNAGVVKVYPLLVDASGEMLAYAPLGNKVLGNAKRKDVWKSWRTHMFYVTEAGGSAYGIYDASGGDGNSWPDGQLAWLGFEVRIQYSDEKGGNQKTGEREGSLYLADVFATGIALSDSAFAYADSLVEQAGSYQIAFQKRAAFQGPPVDEFVRSLKFDPFDEASRRQKIAFPLDDLQSSWLNYRVTNAEGETITEGAFRWSTDLSPDEQVAPSPVNMETQPNIGYLRILDESSEEPFSVRGVFKEEEPTVAHFRVFSGTEVDKQPVRLTWTLTPYRYDTKLASGTESLSVPEKGYQDVEIAWTPESGLDAYRLHYNLVSASGETIDSGVYIMGVARDKVPLRMSRVGKVPDRHEIKETPYMRTTYTQGKTVPKSLDDATAHFMTMLKQSREMADHVTFMVDIAELEPLPGVYDFSLLDAIMDAAFDYQVGITIRLGHGEQRRPYTWQPYTLPRNFDGSVLEGHSFYGTFSLSDQEYVEQWRRGFRVLHDRYSQHPAFEGYYLMKPSGEWILPDEPWKGAVADYSWAAQIAFRDYLRHTLGLGLEALNKRWGSDYSDWEDVRIPMPTWEKGASPDLRPEWLDFMRCKLSWNDDWSVSLAREIRSYDPNRIIMVYIRLMEEPLDKMAGIVDYVHNGGNHYIEAEGQMVDAWSKYKIGWVTEPHFPHHWAYNYNGWVLDRSVFISIAQAGAGGANLHIYYWVQPSMELTAHYGGEYAYDRYEKFKPILRELHDMEIINPAAPVAVIYDDATLLTKHRTTFRARLMDMRRWFELLRADSVPYEIYQTDHETDYQLVVLNPLDEVMTPSSINAVKRMVDGGAWVMMTANTGKYEEGQPDIKFALLRKLGISSPSGIFETGEVDVVASIESGSALSAWSDSMLFYSQAQMQRELKNSDIEFFSWPYRWLPMNDYFGYYRGNTEVGGTVLARFPDGGVAASLHAVGKGHVVVFWGTPSMDIEIMRGLMGWAAGEAQVSYPAKGNPIEHVVEGRNTKLNRFYALCYMDKPGIYTQRILHAPDGEWFIDDMVSGERLGLVQGADLREKGIELVYGNGGSPLKILRLIPGKELRQDGWAQNY